MSSSNEIPLNAIDRHVGRRLRARRLFVQMSEEWLAGFLEISVDELCAIEEGRARAGYDRLVQIGEAIGVPERYFYQGIGQRGPGGGGGGKGEGGSSWVRDVDRWFRDHVSPHEGFFLTVAKGLTGNLENARDLVHDAYAAVLTGERWRSVENPPAFVRKTITNLALNNLRRQRVVPMEPYADKESVGYADMTPDAYQSLADRERLALVMGAVEKLTGKCRQVFIMRRIDDIPPHEIAKQLGMTAHSVESHLSRGLQEVLKHLETHSKRADLKVWVAKRASAVEPAPVAKDTKR